MVTVRDIAKHLGIAASTVSKGLNNASDISEETRQLVLDTAIELGYQPRKRKSNKNGLEKNKVCVFIENMDYENRDEFAYDLIKGFMQSATLRNWEVEIIPSNLNAQSTRQYDKFMLANRYNGAFMIGFAMHEDYIFQIERTRVPTVLFDNYIANNPKVGYVTTDCYEGLKLAISHLYDLGHKRIAFLNGGKNTMVSDERIQAFKEIMTSFHLTVDTNLLENGYYVPDCAKYHVPKFIANGATAIICASDLIASGAIAEVNKQGLRVPDDISIIGFDDLPLCSNLVPPLTTIRQDRFNLGRSAMILLECLIHNIPVSKSMLRAQLVIRESTAPTKRS